MLSHPLVESRGVGKTDPAWSAPCFCLSSSPCFSVFLVFLSLVSIHLSFLFYVIYLHMQTEVISTVSQIFPAILLFRYLMRLDLTSIQVMPIYHTEKQGRVCFLFEPEAQNNSFLEVLYFYKLYFLSVYLIL